MNLVESAVALPGAAIRFTNVLLTTDDAVLGVTGREIVWTHRGTTLYRYRSDHRVHAVPILLVFALINRPEIFDLRPGSSLVEYLLQEGFDVFLVDWGPRMKRTRRWGSMTTSATSCTGRCVRSCVRPVLMS